MREPKPPKEFYITLRDWAAQSDHHSKTVKQVYPSQIIPIPKAKGLEHPTHWQLKSKDYLTLPGEILSLPGGRVWGDQAAVIAPDNKLIWDLSKEYGNTPDNHSIFHQKRLPPIEIMAKTVAVMTFWGSKSYYHWMFDVLPRIHLFEKLGLLIDYYMIDGDSVPARIRDETLGLLGIPREKVLSSRDGLHIQAKELIIAPDFGWFNRLTDWGNIEIEGESYPVATPQWAVDFLRNRFLSTTNPGEHSNAPERIYIGRSDTSRRHVLNEEKVLELLGKRGVVKVELGSKTLEEQIHLFASAELIIAPHGAGLTNLLFCKPGTKILEIFSPLYVNPCYRCLSSQLDLDYSYLIGQGERPPAHVESRNLYDDITIGLTDLNEWLEMFL